jgi:hypothetical protein
MPRAGFEPAIPVAKWPKTYAIDRATTEIGQTTAPSRYNTHTRRHYKTDIDYITMNRGNEKDDTMFYCE